ncbi:MAG: lipopolysaccharide biosynthesis protein [Muribaculaceae bacterium]|nr:lipopolysaccharide biosynthesis protein [Muribaculaceae bacterium]
MQNDAQLKSKVTKGLFWGGLNNGTQQLLNLVIGIFLARLLTPFDYGMVGLLAIFSAIASALQEGGFISALTNRKNANQLDFSSVFWFSTTLSICFYIILFFCAPLIAEFYDEPKLVPLSRFIFLSFVISSINIAPRTFLFKNLRVRDTALITIISLAISGVIAITLSFLGFAYWGLACQTVTYTLCITIFSFIFSRWKLSFQFSLQPIKEMFGYSSKIVITNIFNILNNNIFAVLLGKFYSASDVGDFNQANKWNYMGYSLISGMIHGVAQPTFALTDEEKERQINIFRKLLRFTAFISFPAMFGLSFIAKDFIVITITDKWLFSASILQILCISGAFYPISILLSNLVLSKGRSTSYMWTTIALSLLQIAAVFFSYPYGLFTMLWVYVSINILWIFVWFFVSRKSLPIRLFSFLKDILPFLIITLISIIPVYFITILISNIYLNILIKVFLVAGFYFIILRLLGTQILKESMQFLSHKK